MSTEYQYPPDLFQLLIEAIPLLCRSKQDVISFFAGAGIDHTILDHLKRQLNANRDEVKKHEIVRTVLTHLNEQGDIGIGPRRAVLRRVVEWQNFTTCYPDNQQRAEEMVKHIAKLVNMKDARTRNEEIRLSVSF